MSVTEAPRANATRSLAIALPTWAWVVVSRALVLLVAVASAVFGTRNPDWAVYDPGRTTAHLGWLGNALAAGADRWDAIHYLQIAQHGYSIPGLSTFLPLYPLLIHLLTPVFGSDVVAGAMISCAAFVVALVLLHRLTTAELGPEVATTTVLLLAFAPLSLFFTAIYTESLFLALSLGVFLAARQERWGLVAILIGLASITRVTGILLVAPVLYMWWQSESRSWRGLVWLAMSSVPLIAFSLYLDSLGYGLLALIHDQSAYARSMAGPIATLILAARWSIIAPGQNLPQLIVVVMGLAALAGCWRWLPRAYTIYAALAMIVFLWSPAKNLPLMAVDRYILTVFPLWIVAAKWIRGHRLMLLTFAIEVVMLAYYTSQFATWWFVA